MGLIWGGLAEAKNNEKSTVKIKNWKMTTEKQSVKYN